MAGSIVRCAYEFVGETETDLSIYPGDIIKITEVVNEEWYEGSLNGKRGQFPKGFVEECHDIFDVGIAITAFNGEQDGDLSLKEGELVVVTEVIDENWLSGYVQGGKHGVFPKNFIKSVSFDGNINKEDTSEAQASSNFVKVLFNFVANGDNELQLTEGEMVEILSDSDDFWCEGKASDGRQGMFPRNFVDLPPKEGENVPISSAKESPDMAEYSTTSGLSNAEDIQSNSNEQKKCVADFDFDSGIEGDLKFKIGDEITNVEIIDDSWYRGELFGYTGIFPSNYVRMIETDTQSVPIQYKHNVVESPPVVVEKQKKKPERPKPPPSKKDHVPFCYQFKTEHQPTVIIPPWRLKQDQQNILLLGKQPNNNKLQPTPQSIATSRSPHMSPRHSPSTSMVNINELSSNMNKNFSQVSPGIQSAAASGGKQFQHYGDQWQSSGNTEKLKSYETTAKTQFQHYGDQWQASGNTEKLKAYGTTAKSQYSDQGQSNMNAEKLKSYETTAKTQFESLNKNVPREDMSTYQKMKCANNNLNTVVTVANAVGIKTTKTQVAKGAAKMGATAYVTGSKNPAMKSAAMKGIGGMKK